MSSSPCRAKQPSKCRYHTKQTNDTFSTANGQTLTKSHGVFVLKDEFKTSNFAKGFNSRTGANSYYSGTWDELETLVKANKDDFEPGTGSVDNDVILVNVPPQGFFTSVTEITPENEHLVEDREKVRVEGEKPVSMKFIRGEKQPADYVQIVCYRADVLAQDNDRSNDAEWEIIAINAQKDKRTPMHPTTMLRNANHDEGGTLRPYSDAEWAEAYSYWETHAYVQED